MDTEAPKMQGLLAAELRRLVSDYCTKERNSALIAFKVCDPMPFNTVWATGDADGPGCYLIYTEDGTLSYVGMSESSIGRRLATHNSPAVRASVFWQQSPPFYVSLVKVTQSWEAPSLEAYLTSKSTLQGKPPRVP